MKTKKMLAGKVKRKPKQKQRMKLEEIYRDGLAGVQYSDYQRVKKWTPGEALVLKWEKNNKYDPRAIAVFHGTHRIGYIKRESTEDLHEFRENGVKIYAELVAFNEQNPTWHKITICVKAPESSIDQDDDHGVNQF